MKVRKPRVVYWNDIPTPYMIARFNAVADRGNIRLEAWFDEQPKTSGRSWKLSPEMWHFPSRYLWRAGLGTKRISIPSPLLGSELPDVVVSLYARPSFVLGSFLARGRKVRRAFWCEVTHDQIEHRHPAKEAIKRYLFSRVDGVVTAGQQGVEFALKYGAPSERVFAIGHSFDQGGFRAGAHRARRDRDRLREELGLRGTVFLYVGRYLWLKGLDHLLDAFAVLQQRHAGDVSLLLVGEGPEEQHLRQRCENERLTNVTIAGFAQSAELPRLYAAADVFMFPTLGDTYGMVVDEAMTCSLPVISTSAAGEIHERIEDGGNGFIVPPANSAALLDRMQLLADDPELRARMGAGATKTITKFAPDCWAEKFEGAVEHILAMPPAG